MNREQKPMSDTTPFLERWKKDAKALHERIDADRQAKNEREQAEGTRCDGRCNDGVACSC
jgi:hypothetical protein